MEQDLSKIYHKLNLGLICCSIGYVPQRFVNFINKEGDTFFQNLVNKIIIIDKKGYDKEPTVTELFMLMGKSSLLSQNIFDLNNLKRQHNKDNFKYILEKYTDSLNAVIYIAEYYLNNIDSDIPEANTSIKTSFINQYHYLIKHKEEFDSKFSPYNFPPISINSWLNQNRLNDLKDTFPNSKIPELKVEDFNKKEQASIKEKKEEVKKSKSQLKKEKLQTIKEKAKQEAESYILKRVFNLDV